MSLDRPDAPDASCRSTRVAFHRDVYSLDCLKRAAFRISQFAAVNIIAAGDQYVCELTFQRPLSKEEASELTNAFTVEVLDQDLRETISNETAAIRNTILGHAFSKTGLQG